MPVPVNTLLRRQDYAYLLNDSRARAAVVSAALLPEVAPDIVRVPKAGGEATMVAGLQGCVTDVAVSNGYLYWASCRGVRRTATAH